MLTSFGPTTFAITLGNASLSRCIQLTATATSGDFSVEVCDVPAGGCSSATPTNSIGTVTLDANNNITGFTSSNGRVSGHVWSSMGGSFNVSEGTGSGTIDSADDPTGTRGSWSAGGTGRPFPRQAAGHSHSA